MSVLGMVKGGVGWQHPYGLSASRPRGAYAASWSETADSIAQPISTLPVACSSLSASLALVSQSMLVLITDRCAVHNEIIVGETREKELVKRFNQMFVSQSLSAPTGTVCLFASHL